MKVFVYDEFMPEDIAMMQALYSRSGASAEEHAKKVQEIGSGKFMEQFYVGYGHSSIADCGTTTIFIEGVSILAAKAIQDWQLYAGQETSSRYIDFSKQLIVDPVGTAESKLILERWMSFYTQSLPVLIEHLKTQFPIREGEKQSIYDKAIQARAFDILRGFLPAGVTTQLSWHTNLRQAWDKLALLRHHPLAEIRQIAESILEKLQNKYQNSFGHKLYEEQEAYRRYIGEEWTYHFQESNPEFAFSTNIQAADLEPYKELFAKRPIKTNLPTFLGDLGQVTFEYLLDFGSFRDIQRHRNGICRMPLLTTKYGFQRWYLEQLPTGLREEADQLIDQQVGAISQLDARPFELQHYISLGFNITGRNTHTLPAAVYLIELRSGKTVHPTLRRLTHQMHRAMVKQFPLINLYSDLDIDDWDVRRGLHDISEKKEITV